MSVGGWVAAGCCCAVAAGGVGVAYVANDGSGGTPPSTSTSIITAPPTETVPAPGDRTTGSPVLRPTAASDAARIAAQLPDFDGAHQLDGVDALGYVDQLRRVIPGSKWYFVVVDQVLQCAQSEGVVAARAYVSSDFSSATTVVILSGSQLRNLGQVALDCAFRKLDVFGGGPADTFSPCAEAYHYDASDGARVDRYFTFVASTSSGWCSSLANFHREQGGGQLNVVWSVGV
jgi:hypothetical protein